MPGRSMNTGGEGMGPGHLHLNYSWKEPRAPGCWEGWPGPARAAGLG